MMSHGTALVDGEMAVHHIVMPPCVLQSTSASCLINAVESRLPIAMGELCKQFVHLSIIFNTDSAKSCKLVGKAYQAKYADNPCILIIPTFRLMHRVVICINEMLKPLRLVDTLY